MAERPSAPGPAGPMVTWSVAIGVVAVAGIALALVKASPSVALIVFGSVAIAAAILAVGLVRSRRRTTTPSEQQIIDADLVKWSDAELYAVWVATDAEVVRESQSDYTETAARARDLLLSEIARRRPAETAAWLRSNNALKGEPPRFLLS
ncbi:hypothetical protein E0H75_28180 [Kribbella capetownensis]|uniref:Uncharacterized protein n=1 Tax=Kribbella capetownensis TaxID=1572659 RepID=A0A4R0JF76_9ACTN|nr:hypothetical protein [Kribbella capetownensis]TCC45613.1 hypothetical protein E0H75_28180 [Kribbella capetownensis]